MARENTVAAAIISIVVVIFFGADMLLLLVRPIEMGPGQADLAKILFGALAVAFAQVIGFYLGSSVGSRAKDDALAEAMRRERPQV